MDERTGLDLTRSLLDATAPAAPLVSELYLVADEAREVGWADGRPSIRKASATCGAGVRLLNKGKQAIVTTRSTERAAVTNAFARATEMCRHAPSDPHRRFLSSPAAYPDPPGSDERVFDTPVQDILGRLQEIEGRVLAFDRRIKKIVRLEIECERSVSAMANTMGVAAAKTVTACSVICEVLAEDAGRAEAGWNVAQTRFARDLDPASVAMETAEDVIRSLGGGPIPTGLYPVVVHPRVGTQFLDLLTEALSAEEVQMGRSFLKGKVGARIASDAVSIDDDPLRAGGIASESHDDEGVPHRLLSVVSGGILNSYLYDLRSAARAGTDSTGHGSRAGLAAAPSPDATNFYLRPGDADAADLLAADRRVFLLREVMGLHMADPMTGEFSLGASGDLYENGRFSKAVRGVTIAGTIADVFAGVEAVANDLRWYGAVGAPSLLIRELSIAGA